MEGVNVFMGHYPLVWVLVALSVVGFLAGTLGVLIADAIRPGS